jgi:Domain of unknown function (DUF4388)
VSQDLSQELQTALFELQRYLLDQIPPLNATDAIETLTSYPPDILVKQIKAWALEQGRIQGVPLSDCLFHALKKVHMISTLKLIDQALLEAYLNRVIPLALDLCPPEDRDTLRTNLASLRQSLQFTSVSAVEIGRSAPAPEPPKRSALSEVASKTARRFSLAIERLLRKAGSGGPAPMASPESGGAGQPVAEQPMAQLVSMAAETSSSEEELNQFVDSLKPIAGKQQGDIIGILASSVPGWELAGPAAASAKPSKSIQAMHKVMSLTKDPTKSATRFRELMMSGVEQFNGGSLGAAASILELADLIVKEKKIDATNVDRIRRDALDAISSDQLKKYSENKTKHPVLRKVLGFFPTLRKEALFAELRGEQKPERRRAILGLLEAYGTEAREAALEELGKELDRPVAEADTYYLRNLIYVLHRIQRESDDGNVDKEFDLLKRSSDIGQSIYVIKEAVVPLGQMKTDAAVKLLTTRLAEFEAMLLRGKNVTYPVEEIQKLLDRIIAALGRIGTPVALLTIARHGMKANPVLGDTRARLAVLSQFDLSFDEQTVNVIIKAIRDDLPSGKLLGRLMGKRQAPPTRLIEALSSTKSEVVEQLLSEVAQDFAAEDVGRAAAAALQNLSTAGKPSPAGRENATLTGDLQFFGLPSLMQSLADTQATGIATFLSKDTGQTAGKLLFLKGQFADAQAGALRGVDALYQLLERPIVGSFAFVPNQPENIKIKTSPLPIMPLLMEGIRRYDELKQACVVVPDDVAFKPGTVKPTLSGEEDDAAIVREVWVKASKGGKVRDWESEIATDIYRVRRLVAHWVEEGALQVIA